MKKEFLILIIFVLSSPLLAQGPDQVNLLLDRWNEEKEFMGEILIERNNEPLLHRRLGYRNMDKEMPHDDASTFAIGDVTQTFTAALVMKAVEENKLQLETTLNNYFPKLPNSNRITIRHLLEHRSGLADYTEYLPVYQNPSIGSTVEKLLMHMETSAPAFQPGARHQQVGTNYLILTHILEKAYNKDYQTLLEEKISAPIGLNNTFLTAVNASKLRSKSSGHQNIAQELAPQPAVHPLFTAGSGGINSSASDLDTFIKALLNEEIIPRQNVELMKPKTSNDNYGMGLENFTVVGKNAIGQQGSSNGFQSIILYFPDERVSMVILMNRASANFDGMVTEIGTALFGAETIPTFEEMPEGEPTAAPAASPAAPKPTQAVITGTYAFNPKLKITVFREGGELKAQTANQPPTVLVKEGPLSYKIKGTEGRIRFVTEDDVVTHLIFEQTGFQQKAVKE